LIIAVIGCGNIGLKRLKALEDERDVRVAALVESSSERIEFLKQQFTFDVRGDHREVLSRNEIDAVIVSTPPDASYQIILDCLGAGKDVLCEKPLGRNVEEARTISQLAYAKKAVLKCGFNLRHDVGLQTAVDWLKEGKIGAPYFFKCSYVNGTVAVNSNRVGSLHDMGTHVIDLARWFVGEVESAQARLDRFEYGVKPLDDNGFGILHSGSVPCMVHFSFVRWMNNFTLEITGDKGTIEVRNLPKWGTQQVVLHRRVFPAGIPQVHTSSFEGDQSWKREWLEFSRCVRDRDLKWNQDGLKAMQVAASLRRSSEEGRPARVVYE
jgi:predicted dehydrogenase